MDSVVINHGIFQILAATLICKFLSIAYWFKFRKVK